MGLLLLGTRARVDGETSEDTSPLALGYIWPLSCDWHRLRHESMAQQSAQWTISRQQTQITLGVEMRGLIINNQLKQGIGSD